MAECEMKNMGPCSRSGCRRHAIAYVLGAYLCSDCAMDEPRSSPLTAMLALETEVHRLAADVALNRASLERIEPMLKRLVDRWGNASEKSHVAVYATPSGLMTTLTPREQLECDAKVARGEGFCMRVQYDANGSEVPFDASEYERPVKP